MTLKASSASCATKPWGRLLWTPPQRVPRPTTAPSYPWHPLAEIAKASGGEFRDGSFGNPSVRPPRKVRVGGLRTVEIWSNPMLLLLAVGLLVAEWPLRL